VTTVSHASSSSIKEKEKENQKKRNIKSKRKIFVLMCIITISFMSAKGTTIIGILISL